MADVPREQCAALVWRKDCYRRTGKGPTGMEMHYNRGQCKRRAVEGGLCRQHLTFQQQGHTVLMYDRPWKDGMT